MMRRKAGGERKITGGFINVIVGAIKFVFSHFEL